MLSNSTVDQDIEEDRVLREASTHVQRTWRGWSSRKRTLWLRMEREGRRRLAQLQEELEQKRIFEARTNALQTERRWCQNGVDSLGERSIRTLGRFIGAFR